MKCSRCRKEYDELPPSNICIWCKFAEEDNAPINPGDYVVIVENSSCHGFRMGETVEIERKINDVDRLTYVAINTRRIDFYVRPSDFRRLYPGERR